MATTKKQTVKKPTVPAQKTPAKKKKRTGAGKKSC
jgi:hypothetical protein